MKKNEKGFTLVEMIIVMAIIGILAVTAIPMLFHNKDKADIARLISDYNALKSGALIYYIENEGIIKGDFSYEDVKEYVENISENTPIGGSYYIKGNQVYNDLQYPNSDGSALDEVEDEITWKISLEIEGNDINMTQKQFKQLVEALGEKNILIKENKVICINILR